MILPVTLKAIKGWARSRNSAREISDNVSQGAPARGPQKMLEVILLESDSVPIDNT